MTRMSSLCVSLAALIAAAGSAFASVAPPADPTRFAQDAIAQCRDARDAHNILSPAFKVGDIACLQGDIDRAMARSFLALDLRATETIVVASPGGSVASALDMAEHMGFFAKTLVVDGICASSCANYLFLAARFKIVPDGSIVGWHGAPPRPEGFTAPRELSPEAAAYMTATVWRSDDFFRRIGISDRIARETADGVEVRNPDPQTFWTRSREDLIERWGVGGILYMN